MNSRYHFKHWLASIFAVFLVACLLIGGLLATGSENLTAVGEGEKLFVNQGCAACHQAGASQLAPDLKGIFNSTQTLTDGSKIVADEAYLIDSIKQPQHRIVKGYAAAMPTLPLGEQQIDQIVAYLKSL